MIISLDQIQNSNVFLRVDFNVPFLNDSISDSTRIEKTIPTILKLIENKNKIIITSHLGRPKGFDKKFSLLPVFEKFCEIIDSYISKNNIKFFETIEELESEFTNPENKYQIFMLENLRFWNAEEENNENFKKRFSNLVGFYVNDAFSCSHRAHASIMLYKNFNEDHRAFGLLLENEIKNIKKFFEKENGKKLAIIGGSKISTKIKLIKSFVSKFDFIFIGGAMANMILFYLGHEIGLSLKEELTEELRKFLDEILKNQKCKLIIPSDFICIKEKISENSQVFYKKINEIENNDIILDIGVQSIQDLKSKIDECNMVVWNGPVGMFEMKNFEKGTKEIAEYLASKTKESKILSLIGGGDSISAINAFNIPFESFSHVSTAGGAFLEYIENDLNLIGLKDF